MLSQLMRRRALVQIVAVIAVLAQLAVAVLLMRKLPWWIDRHHIDRHHVDRNHLDRGSATLVTGPRTAIVQLLTIVGASIALIFTDTN
ncbi:hypothetical protein AB0D27_31085 [Streptomyces sp. NPDC048415]|uniref:hypothetical protein n=1 Tax=Streptomyces sp. NPDC048415 TaxID=3154822 RepID=UPI0034499ACD